MKHSPSLFASCLIASISFLSLETCRAEDRKEELIFPLDAQHNHAPGIVELPDGELLVSWYRGSGERKADDVKVLGSRKKPGEAKWSEPFLMVDTPELPDCNTCMMVDQNGQLFLFWPVILANTWESCLTQVAVSTDYSGTGSPQWKRRETLFLKPKDFGPEVLGKLDTFLQSNNIQLDAKQQAGVELVKSRLNDKLYQRLGWQPRCKPTVLRSGRILLPLYTDTFSISLMAISDDGGLTWRASGPLIGYGNIQPAVVERQDGTLVAYMRENGFTGKIRICESRDQGESWTDAFSSELANPGSGLDAVRLQNGRWMLIYNDTLDGRHRLAVSVSEDEGKSWRWTKHLEDSPGHSYHYPAIIQGKDGTIHAVYSYFVPQGKSMKHVAFDEAWVTSQSIPVQPIP
jgi:predicted neuraminidase